MQGLDSLYGGPVKRSGCGEATIGGAATPGAAWPVLALVAAAAMAVRRRARASR
jgi:MYXO-CTERM domain-containing protein